MLKYKKSDFYRIRPPVTFSRMMYNRLSEKVKEKTFDSRVRRTGKWKTDLVCERTLVEYYSYEMKMVNKNPLLFLR